MTTAASPRHPWKALAVVLLVFAVVHGAGAHTGFGDHGSPHVRVLHLDHDSDRDCDNVRIDIDGDDVDIDDDGPDDDATFQSIEHHDWS